jgi:hypothetical protein
METTTSLSRLLSNKLRIEIIKHISENQPYVHWHYSDELSDEQIQKILKSEDGILHVENDLWERNIDHISDLERDAAEHCSNLFEDEITEELGEDRSVWEDEIYDWIRRHIYVDFNINQLLRNTPNPVFFYDTGEEFDGYGQSEAEYRLSRMRIKKLFGITNSDHDEKIMMMLYQASYGGQLVVYFNADISELTESLKGKPNTIRFKNANIAIIHTGNGSGDDCQLQGHSFELPFSRDNLHYEKSISYNYTYDVCSMASNWCDDTGFSFLTKENPGQVKSGSLNSLLSQDAEYQRIFDNGGCSLGDKKHSRHRNTEYINDFPCGTRCHDCGQFWID